MRFAKAQEKKMGKPESTEPVVKKRAPQKSPISRFWISTFFSPRVVLAFILVGGLLFEVLKLFF
ncbi:hypothetical protein J4E86_007691 [Alternaria arbusti]|uniref:uncharacterized protein n=1 Tax=Alternaria arbusti TaxID=232088 RepID=UPI002220652B|nr:uncharacterized protein J4E86_007691 [Alternaria arbusti]KAI4949737.1 hypothetical protein J4E86_007691 [Alternaria arbusti]